MYEAVNACVDMIFGGDSPAKPLTILQIAARTTVIFVMGIAVIRSGKSRLIGNTTPLDVLLGVLLGSLLSRAITGAASLSGTAAAAGMLALLHYCMTALAFHSHRFGNLLKGHTKLLVKDGQIQWESMRSSHISESDLREEMRLNANIDELGDVKVAYKERSGTIGVVRQTRPS